MQIIFSDKFKRQAELGEVGSRDIMELVSAISAEYSVFQKYRSVHVDHFDMVNDSRYELMTEVRVKLFAFSNDLTLANRSWVFVNKRSKSFSCMSIQFEKGDIL